MNEARRARRVFVFVACVAMTSAPVPHEGPAAALLRELYRGADFLDTPRPFADVPPVPAPDARTRPRANARAQPTLLVNGCGRSGTHALVGLLRRKGVGALHEGHGREATVGWPYVGHLDGSWKEYWPMSNQPHGSDVHDPIFKVHRNPLSAVRSIAVGLTSSGGCRNPSERRWDARAWNCASRFVPLPVPREAIDQQQTCKLSAEARLRLALHYWVKWNLLADRWSTHSFAVETLSADNLMQRWCSHCAAKRTCSCPDVASELAARSGSNLTDVRVRARKGHGKRAALDWATLSSVDPNMTLVAKRLAAEYGYA